MKKKIKSLVIGLGDVGLNYDIGKKKYIQTHCKSIELNKNYELIGGVDTNINQLKIFNKIYKKPHFNSLGGALETLNPELIVISCNTENHYKIFNYIKKCKSLKYVILEKPGTYSFKNLKKILFVFKKRKIKVYINYFRLFDKYFIDIANKIKKNKYLDIHVFYNRGIYNNCSHFISFFNLFTKNLLKIKILKVYKQIKNDYEADFQLIYKNARINFFRNNLKNILNQKLIIYGEKSSWTSMKNFNEFSYSGISQDPFIKKNKNYSSDKLIINKNVLTSQMIVYNKIFKNINKEISFYNNNSLKTLDILNDIIFKIKNFKN